MFDCAENERSGVGAFRIQLIVSLSNGSDFGIMERHEPINW